jgi:hypothetical protein
MRFVMPFAVLTETTMGQSTKRMRPLCFTRTPHALLASLLFVFKGLLLNVRHKPAPAVQSKMEDTGSAGSCYHAPVQCTVTALLLLRELKVALRMLRLPSSDEIVAATMAAADTNEDGKVPDCIFMYCSANC